MKIFDAFRIKPVRVDLRSDIGEPWVDSSERPFTDTARLFLFQIGEIQTRGALALAMTTYRARVFPLAVWVRWSAVVVLDEAIFGEKFHEVEVDPSSTAIQVRDEIEAYWRKTSR